MIIQSSNNNVLGWSSTIAKLSFSTSVIVFVKDLTIITVFCIRKWMEGKESAKMRPDPTLN